MLLRHFDYSKCMNTIHKISILGCGWIGKRLQETLLGDVSCLSRDIQDNVQQGYYACDVFIIAIPPRGDYLEVLEASMVKLSEKTQVILLSSISFYDGKNSVIEAETIVQKMKPDVVVLRLGGLMGYDRIAGKYTAGKVLTANSGTNYVHRDDVLGVVESIISNEVRAEVFDVVAPIQTTKKTIFTQNAKKFGFEETIFLEAEEPSKVLSPTKLCKILGYNFKKPDVLRFWS